MVFTHIIFLNPQNNFRKRMLLTFPHQDDKGARGEKTKQAKPTALPR